MQLHGPKRVYNVSALESWFERLVESWESHFPGSSLEMGRQFYREGLVREIELGEKDAIIHSKIDGRECYSVIEWEEQGLRSRTSMSERNVGEALAVAGLYEIEEMIVEEVSPLPPAGEEEKETTPDEESLRARAEAKRFVEPEARPLVLEFDVSQGGLVFAAFWIGGESGSAEARVPALPHARNGAGTIVSSERERLIRLASLARKAQFQFCQETQSYLLEGATRIQRFVTDELPSWQRFFDITVSPAVQRLKQTVTPVDGVVRAEAGRKGGINLEWVFRAGGEFLDEEELARLKKADKGPVLLPRLGFVEMSEKQRGALRDWQDKARTAGSEESPRYLLLSLFADAAWNLETSPEITAWKEELMKPAGDDLSLPEFLREYQREGVSWMARMAELGCHGLLADEMGLGKTVQTLALIAARPTEERIHLVVTPASVVPVWQREAARFFPDLSVHVLKGGNNFVEHPADGIWVASYHQIRRHRELLSKANFGYVVLDEGQLIKNPEAKIARCCFSIRGRHRFVLTGTPLENRQLDLWSLFHFLMPGLLGSKAAFEAVSGKEDDAALARIRSQIAPFVMRRTKDRVAGELPQKVEMALAAPLTQEQRNEYGRICQEGLSRLGDELEPAIRERSFGLFSLLTRLRQVCCDPGLLPWKDSGYEESGKISVLLEHLSSVLQAGHKVVIFSQFVTFLDRVERALQDNFPAVKRFRLTGSTVNREAPVEEFQNHEGAGVMLISLKAGGTGITLHSADYVFLLDPWWNPAVEEQAIDRVHRLGQTQTVMVFRIVTSGTIEERIQRLKEEKRDLFENLVGHLGAVEGMRERFHSLRSLIELTEETDVADSE